MLSERQLARGFRPWWAQWAPGLGRAWISRMQARATQAHRVVRWAPALHSALAPRDADLIAETAFGFFANAFQAQCSIESLPDRIRAAIVQAATHRIMLLRGSGRDLTGVMSKAHLLESEALAIRLLDWTRTREHPPEIQPRLPGLGLVDACHPDIIAGPELIEVKMASSLFRLDDIRQVLIYAALIWRGTDRPLETVTLTNPRLGIDWNLPLREMVQEISGQSMSEFFEAFEQMGQDG